MLPVRWQSRRFCKCNKPDNRDRFGPAVTFVQTMSVSLLQDSVLAVHIYWQCLAEVGSARGQCILTSSTCALLAEVRLAYSHVVVLDSFFGEAEREPLLSQLTESGWDHTRVSITPGSELPRVRLE